MKTEIPITGVWLYRRGKDLIVSVEIKGKLREVIKENWPADGCGEISHFAHPLGILRAPLDRMERKRRK